VWWRWIRPVPSKILQRRVAAVFSGCGGTREAVLRGGGGGGKVSTHARSMDKLLINGGSYVRNCVKINL
jgi:hypothetical protein